MYINKNEISGIVPIYPRGTNSTMFTQCCEVAICSDELRCPSCERLVVGYDAESDNERVKIRWKSAYKG